MFGFVSVWTFQESLPVSIWFRCNPKSLNWNYDNKKSSVFVPQNFYTNSKRSHKFFRALSNRKKCIEVEMNEKVDLSGDGGVIKIIQKKGNGKKVEEGDFVKVHYQGNLDNGEIFDSSFDREEPYSFKLGQGKVIKGWEIGIKSMKIGEKSDFFISSVYGYKKKGIPPIIPPNANLCFQIELLDSSENNDKLDGFYNEKNSNVPRTPKAISEDFKKRISDKKEKTGSFGDFFFISPFRSQTGEKAPWWLNPNITFVLAGIILLLIFSAVISIGGIHQGYVDESFDANPLK